MSITLTKHENQKLMKIYSYISTCNKAIIRETVKLYFTNATDIKKLIVIATYTHTN